MKKIVSLLTGSLFIVFVAIQFVPVETGANPPVESDIAAPDEVAAILRRSCYDCHSNETRWPWYNRIAPASWLVARDVRKARSQYNFSTWNRYNAEKKSELLKEMWEEVEEGEMPPWFYTPLHPDARLTDEDKAVLKDWSVRTSEIQEIKADVEDTVGDFLKDSERALEDAAEGLLKVGEKAIKAAEDALERASREAEEAAEEEAERREDRERDRLREDNSGPGSANSGRDI